MRSVTRPDKDEVVVEHAAVATAHPLASEVGVEVLKQGGNAIDAAIAIGFCLNVIEPWNSSIAGHGQMIVYASDKTKSLVLDYGHKAPLKATKDMFKITGQSEKSVGTYDVEDNANSIGYRSVGVPGITAGMCKAHDMFGTLPLEQLIEPAYHYAKNGFEADTMTCLMIAQTMSELDRYPETRKIFLPNGYPIKPGEQLVQTNLAETLRQIGKEGKAALYEGDIAQAIHEDMKRNDGVLTSDDLAKFEVQVLEPARTLYRGYEILGSPVPCGGTTQRQILTILENFDLSNLMHNSPEHLHLFIESARHAFADRYRFLGDPDFGPVPLDGILSTKYASEIAGLVDRQNATMERERTRQPWITFADTDLHNPWAHDPLQQPDKPQTSSPPSANDCTTHFSVIDKDRNMVSCTQTAVQGFGSRVVIPGTGILLTNGMVVFNPKQGSPNSIAGYKRGLNNMAPALILRNGSPFLSLGAPGGRRIISRLAQVLVNVIDFGQGIQEAITSPTVDAAERETLVDKRIENVTIEKLEEMGHNIRVVPEETSVISGFSRPRGVMVNPQTNRIHAGVQPTGTDDAHGY